MNPNAYQLFSLGGYVMALCDSIQTGIFIAQWSCDTMFCLHVCTRLMNRQSWRLSSFKGHKHEEGEKIHWEREKNSKSVQWYDEGFLTVLSRGVELVISKK